METGPDMRLARSGGLISLAASGLTIIVGIVVLIGWKLDIMVLKRMMPGMVAMKPNTAFSFLLAGLSLAGMQTLKTVARPELKIWIRRIAQACATAVSLIGLLTIIEHLADLDFGIDQLLFTEPDSAALTSHPVRMGFITAINFLLTGIAIMIIDAKRTVLYRISTAAAFIITVDSMFGFLGYAYGIQQLYHVSSYTAMALHTAITFIVLAVGIVSAWSDRLLRKEAGTFRNLQVYFLALTFIAGVLFTGIYEKARWDSETDRERQDHEIIGLIDDLGRIMTLDETLTMSAKMAAASGDSEYDMRYRRAEKELDGLIAGFRARFSSAETVRHIDAVDTANRLLVAMEHRSLDLTRKGRGPEALEILQSREYQMHKEAYTKGVGDALRSVQDRHAAYFVQSGRYKRFFVTIGILGTGLIVVGWLLSVRAVAGRKRAEADLYLTIRKLELSKKDLEQFAFISSHDLQEPLRRIASFAEALRKRYHGRLDQDADRYIEYIVDGVHMMRAQIKAFIAYSSLDREKGKTTDTDLSLVLERVVADMRDLIDENNAAVTWDRLPVVRIDKEQIGLVFLRLFDNAIKFRGSEPPHIHVGAEEREHDWVLSVRDNGIGIEPEYLERIFVPFQRLHPKDEYAGAGIGLAICKKIIERHGGRIWAESVHGRGSVFHFTIMKERIW